MAAAVATAMAGLLLLSAGQFNRSRSPGLPAGRRLACKVTKFF